MRRTLKAAAAAGLVLLLLAGGGCLWLRSSLPQVDGTIRVAGLAAPVAIARDAHGIPYITAGNEADAHFALGFVHAQDRLAQMELTRLSAAGRLAELLGPGMLAHDRLMRTFGVSRLAAADAEELPAPVRAALAAYAAGVNAFLDTRSGALPLEFQLLWHSPAPWTAADSLVWGRMMALRLTDGWSSERLRASLARHLPLERVEALWPPYPADAPTTVERGSTAVDPEGVRRFGARAGQGAPSALFGDHADGSNAWALAADRTGTGAPLLANDPHLGLSLPGTWYLARIDTPELTLAGATAPGVPFLILGHNGHAAWGLTTTHGDAADLFRERVAPADPGEYLAPGAPRPFLVRNELISVRFADDALHVVRATRNGPVVSDVMPEVAAIAGRGEVVALANTALLPGDVGAAALHAANRARGWDDFRAALAGFRSPQQNVLYADRAGTIALAMPGQVPLRRSGDGFLPAAGWTGEQDWTGFVPLDRLPAVVEPASGAIVNANNRLVPEDWPYRIASRWPDPYRAERIGRVLAAQTAHGPDQAAELQLDEVSLGAGAVLDGFLAVAPRTERGRAAREMLGAWDRRMAREAREPLIYYAWVREAMRAIYADELGPDFPSWWSDRPLVLLSTLERDPSWCDDVRTPAVESCDEQIAGALEAALDFIEERYDAATRWGDVHRATFRHALFGRVPVLRELILAEIPNGGGNHTVNRGGLWLGSEEEPFRQVHGPSYRAIYDLSDLDRSRFMHAPGQSGNPFSPHYADLIEPWRDGHYLSLAPPAAPAHVLRLEPAAEGR